MVLKIGGWLLMKKNDLLKKDDVIVRVLDMDCDKLLIINCINKTMPEWVDMSSLESFAVCTEQELTERNRVVLEDIEELDAESKKQAYEHYTLIAGVLPFVLNTAKRSEAIDGVSKDKNVSKQTIRKYLIQYLIYQNLNYLSF